MPAKPKARSTTTKKRKQARRKRSEREILKERLDRCFSWYVRLIEADNDGNVSCITCETVRHWTEVDAGHFISRRYLAVRWRPENVKPQCKRCNMRHAGEQWLFSRALQKQYGEQICETLYNTATNGKPPTTEQLKIYLEWYEHQVTTILTRRIERDSRERGSVPKALNQRIQLHGPHGRGED